MTSDDRCPKCGHAPAWGVEIRGVYDGVLLWECPFCNHRWPRFTTGTLHDRAVKFLEVATRMSGQPGPSPSEKQ